MTRNMLTCASSVDRDATFDAAYLAMIIEERYSSQDDHKEEERKKRAVEKEQKEKDLAQIVENLGFENLSGLIRLCSRIAKRRLCCWHDVQDAVAGVCLGLVGNLNKCRLFSFEQLRRWLVRVTQNTCVDIVRNAVHRAKLKEKFRLEMEGLARLKAEGVSALEAYEDYHVLYRAIDALGHYERDALLSLYFEGESPKKISLRQHVTLGAFYVRTHRAIGNLKAILTRQSRAWQ